VGSGVKIQGHDGLRANARLASTPQAARSLEHALPPILREAEAIQFSVSRGSEDALSVLELTEVQDPEAVTLEQPLVIQADVSLNSGEYVLASAFDPELGLYIPLGMTGTTSDAPKLKFEINLERLPGLSPTDPSEGSVKAVNERSIGGSIRIWFHKFVARKFGLEDQYPLLRAVEVSDAGKVIYHEGCG
jgi:hypothetical protein